MITNYYKQMKISSGFAEDRGSYLHSGLDYVGDKKTAVVAMYDSIFIVEKFNEKYFGKELVLATNAKFFGGANDVFYHSYCHLGWSPKITNGDFFKNGQTIAFMGNSGGCYTKHSRDGWLQNQYRKITKEEQEDENCNYGVHLHFYVYQDCKYGKETKLLKDLMKRNLVSKNTVCSTHFWQWGKLIIAPRIIDAYYKLMR